MPELSATVVLACIDLVTDYNGTAHAIVKGQIDHIVYVLLTPQFSKSRRIRIIAQNAGIRDVFGEPPDTASLEIYDCSIAHCLPVPG